MNRRYFDPGRVPRSPYIPTTDAWLRAARPLPAQVDFSQLCTIRDQGPEGACTGFGETGQYQVARAVAGLPPKGLLFSPQFLYFLEGQREGHPGQDTGAVPTDGLAILEHIGVAPESLDPYVPGRIAPPSARALAAAAGYRIKSWSAVSRVAPASPRAALLPVLRLLAQRKPINVAISVYQSFENAPNGVIPMPGPDETLLGGHDLYLVGYKDDPAFPGGGYVKAANSWGTTWGQGGFALIPYAFASDPDLTLGLWSIELPPAARTRRSLLHRVCGGG